MSRPIRIEWRWPNGDTGVIELEESKWTDLPTYSWHYQRNEYGAGSAPGRPLEYKEAHARLFAERQRALQVERRNPLPNLWQRFLR